MSPISPGFFCSNETEIMKEQKPIILASTILRFRVLGPSQSVLQSWTMVPWSYCFVSSLGSQNSWVVSVIALNFGVSDPSVLRVIALSWRRCWKPQPLLFQILSSRNSAALWNSSGSQVLQLSKLWPLCSPLLSMAWLFSATRVPQP